MEKKLKEGICVAKKQEANVPSLAEHDVRKFTENFIILTQ